MSPIFAAGLAVVFYSAVVEPKIIRAVEREKNSNKALKLESKQ